MKRMSTSVMREMQIETTMRYYFTPARMALIEENNKRVRGCRETAKPSRTWCENVKVVWGFLQKLKFLYDPGIPRIYPSKLEIHVHTKTGI